MTVKEWEEMCLNNGYLYYWAKDTVQVTDAKNCVPTYKSGVLEFIVDHERLGDGLVHTQEAECVAQHILDVKNTFNIN